MPTAGGAGAAERVALVRYQGPAGDHNDRAVPGAARVADELARRLRLPVTVVGTPRPAAPARWDVELPVALPALRELAATHDAILAADRVPVAALTRCAAALATLPVLARHRPDACVVWFDAHGDLNVPDASASGYLGGMVLSAAAGRWESGLGAGLELGNVVLAGARDLDPDERRLVADGTVALAGVGADLPARLRQLVRGRPVYVHLDCDVLEPGLVPTDYRVPGGLSLADLAGAAAALAEHEIVGVEIAEFEVAADAGTADAGPLLDALAPLLAG
ncbi:arginase family protein [Micromonospora sp. PLK6-60]|uniref:arginase family protein n=1 Tax=Micromonospora sp. PLK6-60 TaxID=2873383 RepID=UPI001CA6C310|nr:arginase family protein [Micromonospora sp. PLK6-60]MBY8875240.1 arginase family protein [Micromonospora sp. PLK6-60]